MLYENAQDRRNEEEISQVVSFAWGVRLLKLPDMAYHIDRAVVDADDEIVGWAELKRRHFPFKAYPTVMLDVQKWTTGKVLSEATCAPFYFIVGFDDVLAFYEYSPNTRISVKYGGRTAKTRDVNDVEPVVHIPMRCFTAVTRKVFTKDGVVDVGRVPKNLFRVKSKQAVKLWAPKDVLEAGKEVPVSKPKQSIRKDI